MNRIFILALLPLALSGCYITMGLQGASQQIPDAVGQLDETVYAIAIAKDQAARRFEAQVNGTMPTLPPLPAPVSKPPAPVPAPTPVPTVP